MHELLLPVEVTRAEATRRCDAYLRSRWRRWSLASRTIERELHTDLVGVLAWHELVRELLRDPEGVFERRRDARRLTEELEAAHAGEARGAAGRALEAAVHRHNLSAHLLRGPLQAYADEEHVHAYETRQDLARQALRFARPEGRVLLSVLGLEGERNEILVDALALALQLTSWLVRTEEDLEAGRLHLAMEDVTRHAVDLASLRRGRATDGVRRLVADHIGWTRSQYAKGWGLCDALGKWRGRQLAFLLRWHAASLSAIEARGYDPFGGPPSAGWPRVVACAGVSLGTTEPPLFGARPAR